METPAVWPETEAEEGKQKRTATGQGGRDVEQVYVNVEGKVNQRTRA